MSKTIYASDLGKCYKKSGDYRLYKVDGLWEIYFVSKELIEQGDTYIVGKRLEALPVGYLNDPENFEGAVWEFKAETRRMVEEVKREFGF